MDDFKVGDWIKLPRGAVAKIHAIEMPYFYYTLAMTTSLNPNLRRSGFKDLSHFYRHTIKLEGIELEIAKLLYD
jgi:hypothetical protein